MEVADEAIAVLRAAYDKVKLYPDDKQDGWTHMLALRQAVEQVLPAQRQDQRDEMYERGARELARVESGVEEWDNYDPAFQDLKREHARATIVAAVTLPR